MSNNPYLGSSADELGKALAWQQKLVTGLVTLINAVGPDPLSSAECGCDSLDRLDDAIGDCRGAIEQINEALTQAGLDAQAYHQAVARNLRAAE